MSKILNEINLGIKKNNFVIRKKKTYKKALVVDRADISSELLGITRTASKCAAKDWNPKFYDYKVHDKKYSPPDACNVTFGHIQACDHKQKMPKDSGLDKAKDSK